MSSTAATASQSSPDLQAAFRNLVNTGSESGPVPIHSDRQEAPFIHLLQLLQYFAGRDPQSEIIGYTFCNQQCHLRIPIKIVDLCKGQISCPECHEQLYCSAYISNSRQTFNGHHGNDSQSTFSGHHSQSSRGSKRSSFQSSSSQQKTPNDRVENEVADHIIPNDPKTSEHIKNAARGASSPPYPLNRRPSVTTLSSLAVQYSDTGDDDPVLWSKPGRKTGTFHNETVMRNLLRSQSRNSQEYPISSATNSIYSLGRTGSVSSQDSSQMRALQSWAQRPFNLDHANESDLQYYYSNTARHSPKSTIRHLHTPYMAIGLPGLPDVSVPESSSAEEKDGIIQRRNIYQHHGRSLSSAPSEQQDLSLVEESSDEGEIVTDGNSKSNPSGDNGVTESVEKQSDSPGNPNNGSTTPPVSQIITDQPKQDSETSLTQLKIGKDEGAASLPHEKKKSNRMWFKLKSKFTIDVSARAKKTKKMSAGDACVIPVRKKSKGTRTRAAARTIKVSAGVVFRNLKNPKKILSSSLTEPQNNPPNGPNNSSTAREALFDSSHVAETTLSNGSSGLPSDTSRGAPEYSNTPDKKDQKKQQQPNDTATTIVPSLPASLLLAPGASSEPAQLDSISGISAESPSPPAPPQQRQQHQQSASLSLNDLETATRLAEAAINGPRIPGSPDYVSVQRNIEGQIGVNFVEARIMMTVTDRGGGL